MLLFRDCGPRRSRTGIPRLNKRTPDTCSFFHSFAPFRTLEPFRSRLPNLRLFVGLVRRVECGPQRLLGAALDFLVAVAFV